MECTCLDVEVGCKGVPVSSMASFLKDIGYAGGERVLKKIGEVTVDASRKIPQEFWQQVKQIMGSSKGNDSYLYNEQNQKIYDDEGKERLLRRYWEKCFKISEEENENFNLEHEEEVIESLRLLQEQLTPPPTINLKLLEQLGTENYLMTKITTYEIKCTIKNFRKGKGFCDTVAISL